MEMSISFFLTYFRRVRIAFRCRLLFVSLFLSFYLILFIFFLFEGRPISTVVLHPAGSQVCFFLEELEGKGEGAQNLALIP